MSLVETKHINLTDKSGASFYSKALCIFSRFGENEKAPALFVASNNQHSFSFAITCSNYIHSLLLSKKPIPIFLLLYKIIYIRKPQDHG
jgi:hypothetical protein